MNNIRKSVLMGTCFIGVFGFWIPRSEAETATKIYPITNQMVEAIKNAADANAALDALCKQHGLVRGSGFTAGNMCKLQDFARLAVAACSGYSKGKDTFKGSNCEKKAAGVSVTDPQRAADGMKAAVEAKVSYLTNARLFICGPEALGAAGLETYRSKLPARLKTIADQSCPKSGPPARPKTAAPPLPKKTVIKLVEEELGKAKLVQQAISLGAQELGSAKLPRQRININVHEMNLAQRSAYLTVKNEPDQAPSLIDGAKQVVDSLTNLFRDLNAKGGDVPEEKVKEIQSFQGDLEKVKTAAELKKELREVVQEAQSLSKNPAPLE